MRAGGHLYGMEKMWALNHYRKEGPPLPFSDTMRRYLQRFTRVEDFRSESKPGTPAVEAHAPA
jgi:la-related protein 1